MQLQCFTGCQSGNELYTHNFISFFTFLPLRVANISIYHELCKLVSGVLYLCDMPQCFISRALVYVSGASRPYTHVRPCVQLKSGKNFVKKFPYSICQSYHKIGPIFKFRIILACVCFSSTFKLIHRRRFYHRFTPFVVLG